VSLAEEKARLGIAKLGRVCGFAPDAAKSAAVVVVAERLRSLPEFTRKLLAHVIDLTYREHHDGRKSGTAYLPEVYETCGIGVDEMYAELQRLERSGFIHLEGEYPFQDIVPLDVHLEDQSLWPFMRDLAAFCAAEKISLRDFIVDLQFGRLA